MKNPRNKNKQINKQERITDKPRKKTINTTHMRETEKCDMGCLERRQQPSPAVMIARFRSNKRYKQGQGDLGRDVWEKTTVICGALE